MKTKYTYSCEKCNKEFTDYFSCEIHVAKCANLHAKFRENVKSAVALAETNFWDVISEITFKTDEELDYYAPCKEYELYKFEIECTLANGNQFTICDGMDESLHLGNYLESYVIYNSLEREIKNRLATKYEGIITWDYIDAWRTNFLGDIELDQIVDRLNGRKVKIEVID